MLFLITAYSENGGYCNKEPGKGRENGRSEKSTEVRVIGTKERVMTIAKFIILFLMCEKCDTNRIQMRGRYG